jgi:hypothetical protein
MSSNENEKRHLETKRLSVDRWVQARHIYLEYRRIEEARLQAQSTARGAAVYAASSTLVVAALLFSASELMQSHVFDVLASSASRVAGSAGSIAVLIAPPAILLVAAIIRLILSPSWKAKRRTLSERYTLDDLDDLKELERRFDFNQRPPPPNTSGK